MHFVDPGLRNAAIGGFSPDLERRADRGTLAEAWVYAELLKTLPEDWTIHFWRTKGGAEMDFVVTHGDRVIGVEVKAGARESISRSVRSFIDAYSPELVLLTSARSGEEVRLGSTSVERVSFSGLSTRLALAVALRTHPS